MLRQSGIINSFPLVDSRASLIKIKERFLSFNCLKCIYLRIPLNNKSHLRSSFCDLSFYRNFEQKVLHSIRYSNNFYVA